MHLTVNVYDSRTICAYKRHAPNNAEYGKCIFVWYQEFVLGNMLDLEKYLVSLRGDGVLWV